MPGVRCTIPSCKNSCQKTKNSEKKITYHRFPKNEQVRIVWLKKCFPSLWNYNSCHICSEHFNEDDFEKDMKEQMLGIPSRRILKPNAIPSQKLKNFIQEETIPLSKRKKAEEKELLNIYATRRNADCSNFMIDIDDLEESDEENTYQIEIVNPNETNSNENDPKVVVNVTETTLEAEFKKANRILRDQIKNLKSKLLTQENFKKESEQLKNEIYTLRRTLLSTEKELKNLTNQFNRRELFLKRKMIRNREAFLLLRKMLLKKFTSNQIKILLNRKKNIKWTENEILMALRIRNLSKRSYFHLTEHLKYPLPGLTALHKWSNERIKRFGILQDILKCLKITSKNYTSTDKVAILQFDEMQMKEILEYQEYNEEIIGPFSKMQIVLARGLFSNWIQPIYINFDIKITKFLISELIKKLYFCGFIVKAICGPCDSVIWSSFDISPEHFWLLHPITNEQIFFFPDSLQAIKLLRNELLDSGFVLENGGFVNKTPLEALVRFANTELSEKHIYFDDKGRENSELAIQLLSYSTSMALSHYRPGKNIEIAEYTAYFIEKVNIWMVLMNLSDGLYAENPFNFEYGISEEQQNAFLGEFYELIKNLRCLQKDFEEIFQRGILISINSLKNLLDNIKKNYSKNILQTYKLNLDSLNNLFMNLKDNDDNPPTPLEAYFKFRLLIMGKAKLNNRYINIKNGEDSFILKDFFISLNKGIAIKKKAKMLIPHNLIITESCEEKLLYLGERIVEKVSYDAPELLESMLKLYEHNYCLPDLTNSKQIPNEFILLSTEFIQKLESLELHFIKCMGESFLKGPGIRKKLIRYLQVNHSEIEKKLIETFVDERIEIRIRSLNSRLKENLEKIVI